MPTTFTHRVLIIVPTHLQAAANQAALQFDPEGGQHTFTVPASATGQNPPTHYLTCTALRDDVHGAVQQLIAGPFAGTQMLECELTEDPDDPMSPQSVLAAAGLVRIVEERA